VPQLQHPQQQLQHPQAQMSSSLPPLGPLLLQKSLTDLNLSHRSLSSVHASLISLTLQNNLSLRTLKLGYNDLKDEGCEKICEGVSPHPSLRDVDFGFNDISCHGMKAVAKTLNTLNSKIRTLYFSGNRVGPEGATALALALKTDAKIENLHLTANPLGDAGIEAICDAVPHSVLTTLHLDGTGINSNNSHHLAKMFSLVPSRFKDFRCDNNSLQDSDCVLISDAMDSNTSLELENLELSHNNIGDLGASRLARSLVASTKNCNYDDGDDSMSDVHTRQIQKLSLGNNSIGDSGVIAIAGAIDDMRVQNLAVPFNRFSTSGIQHLMSALSSNESLTSLTLSGISLSDLASKSIAYALVTNKHLHTLYLDTRITATQSLHVCSGVVSNTRSALRTLTGFRLGVLAVRLGFASIVESWSNDWVLNFLRMMWRLGREETSEVTGTEVEQKPTATKSSHEKTDIAEPEEVLRQATKAFERMGIDQSLRFMVFGAENPAVMMPPPPPQFPYGHLYSNSNSSNNSNSNSNNNSNNNLSACSVPSPSSVRTKTIIDLNQQITKLPMWPQLQSLLAGCLGNFSSRELWRLHQYYYSPVDVEASPLPPQHRADEVGVDMTGFRERSGSNASTLSSGQLSTSLQSIGQQSTGHLSSGHPSNAQLSVNSASPSLSPSISNNSSKNNSRSNSVSFHNKAMQPPQPLSRGLGLVKASSQRRLQDLIDDPSTNANVSVNRGNDKDKARGKKRRSTAPTVMDNGYQLDKCNGGDTNNQRELMVGRGEMDVSELMTDALDNYGADDGVGSNGGVGAIMQGSGEDSVDIGYHLDIPQGVNNSRQQQQQADDNYGDSDHSISDESAKLKKRGSQGIMTHISRYPRLMRYLDGLHNGDSCRKLEILRQLRLLEEQVSGISKNILATEDINDEDVFEYLLLDFKNF